MQHEYSAASGSPEVPDTDVPDYRLAVAYGGDKIPADDPYRFLPTLGEIDQHLISEGRHEQLWTGARRARARLRDPQRTGPRRVLRRLGPERPRRAGGR